jgi:hypothetical protein
MKITFALALLLGAVLCVDYYPQQHQQQYQQHNYIYPQQPQQNTYYAQPAYGQHAYTKDNRNPSKPLDGEFIEGTLKAGGENDDESHGIVATKYYVFITGQFDRKMTIGG